MFYSKYSVDNKIFKLHIYFTIQYNSIKWHVFNCIHNYKNILVCIKNSFLFRTWETSFNFEANNNTFAFWGTFTKNTVNILDPSYRLATCR